MQSKEHPKNVSGEALANSPCYSVAAYVYQQAAKYSLREPLKNYLARAGVVEFGLDPQKSVHLLRINFDVCGGA